MTTKLMLSTLLAATMGTGVAFANDNTHQSGATQSGAEYTDKQLKKSGKGGHADDRATHGDPMRGNTTTRSGADSSAESKSGAEYSAEQLEKSRSGSANDGTMRGTTNSQPMNRTDRSSMSDNKAKSSGDAGTKAIGDGTKKP